MLAATHKASLLIEAGKLTGKRIRLKKTEYRIGSDRRCDIRLKGNFLSPLHAVLKIRDEGQWVIQNRSPNQTLVNDRIIDSRPLVVGDVIQIGAEILLKFEVAAPSGKGSSKPLGGHFTFTQVANLLKKPSVAIGLLVYVGSTFLLVSSIGGLGTATESDWSRLKLRNSITQTKMFLSSPKNFVVSTEDRKTLNQFGLLDGQTRDSNALSSYDRIVNFHRSQRPDRNEILAREIDSLLTNIDLKLKQVWHLEQQQRWSEAASEYTLLVEALPNMALPLTKLILLRKRLCVRKAGDTKH